MKTSREEERLLMDNVSDYEMFRMGKLRKQVEDDNMSAHFSNKHSNYSDGSSQKCAPKLTLNYAVEYELRRKLQQSQQEKMQLQGKYRELEAKYQAALNEAEHYKRKYLQKSRKDKETKEKLQHWVNTVKSDLIHP